MTADPALSSRYDPTEVEPRWIEVWAKEVNRADARSEAARARASAATT